MNLVREIRVTIKRPSFTAEVTVQTCLFELPLTVKSEALRSSAVASAVLRPNSLIFASSNRALVNNLSRSPSTPATLDLISGSRPIPSQFDCIRHFVPSAPFLHYLWPWLDKLCETTCIDPVQYRQRLSYLLFPFMKSAGLNGLDVHWCKTLSQLAHQ